MRKGPERTRDPFLLVERGYLTLVPGRMTTAASACPWRAQARGGAEGRRPRAWLAGADKTFTESNYCPADHAPAGSAAAVTVTTRYMEPYSSLLNDCNRSMQSLRGHGKYSAWVSSSHLAPVSSWILAPAP